MKMIIAALCILFVASTVNAGPIYRCTDKDGSILTTNAPQDGMKCVNKDGDGSVQDQHSGGTIQKDDGGAVVLDNRQWQRNRLRQINEQARERKRQQEEETE
jgi:hypothetical protein